MRQHGSTRSRSCNALQLELPSDPKSSPQRDLLRLLLLLSPVCTPLSTPPLYSLQLLLSLSTTLTNRPQALLRLFSATCAFCSRAAVFVLLPRLELVTQHALHISFLTAQPGIERSDSKLELALRMHRRAQLDRQRNLRRIEDGSDASGQASKPTSTRARRRAT